MQMTKTIFIIIRFTYKSWVFEMLMGPLTDLWLYFNKRQKKETKAAKENLSSKSIKVKKNELLDCFHVQTFWKGSGVKTDPLLWKHAARARAQWADFFFYPNVWRQKSSVRGKAQKFDESEEEEAEGSRCGQMFPQNSGAADSEFMKREKKVPGELQPGGLTWDVSGLTCLSVERQLAPPHDHSPPQERIGERLLLQTLQHPNGRTEAFTARSLSHERRGDRGEGGAGPARTPTGVCCFHWPGPAGRGGVRRAVNELR